MPLVFAILTAIIAQMLIYLGLLFMAGKLLPTLLTTFYHLIPTSNYRLLICSTTIMLAGNYFFQKLYSMQPILIAGIISTICGICIVNVGGLIIEQKTPNILMITGVILLASGGAICVYARNQL